MEEVYHLLYVDGWNDELGEPLGGGRCVGDYPTIETALEALAAYSASARIMWGQGHLVITNESHDLVAVDSRNPRSRPTPFDLIARN